MPLSQLLRKLAGRDSPRPGQTPVALGDWPRDSEVVMMGCDSGLCQYAVTAEVVTAQDGRRSPCSSSSSTSDEDAVQHTFTGVFGRVASAPQDTACSPSSLDWSLPSSLSGDSSHPAAARAVRAKGKALLRSSTTEADEQQHAPALDELCSLSHGGQLESKHIDRFDSGSSSMEAQLFNMCTSPASHSYQRSATALLPAWTSTLTVNTSTQGGVHTTTAAGPAISRDQVTAAVAEDNHSPHSPGPLVWPGSAAAVAGDDAFWCEDCELHCEWEDGVVASWLTDMDHPGLLEMLHSEEELEATAAPQPVDLTPRATVQAVYSSSLYN